MITDAKTLSDANARSFYVTTRTLGVTDLPKRDKLFQMIDLFAVAVEGGENGLDETANKAEQTLNDNVDDDLEAVDNQDDIGQNAETNEASDTTTELANNVNVLRAALGAVGNAVVVALGETKLAGETLDKLQEAKTQAGLDISLDDSKAKEIGVEGNDGIDNALEVETSQGTANILQVSADVGLEVNLNIGLELELNIGDGGKDNGEQAGLAVFVLGVVLDDLGGRLGAEGTELDVGGGIDADVRLGPGTLELLANTGLGLEVKLLARSTGASLGPWAVAHVVRALVASIGLLGLEDADVEVDIDINVDKTANLNFGFNVSIDADGGRGKTGQAGEGSDETHICKCEKDNTTKASRDRLKVR